MKSNYMKYSLLTAVLIGITLAGRAQAPAEDKVTANNNGNHYSFDRIHKENGKQVEQVQMWLSDNENDKFYKLELVDDKLTRLSINDKNIPESDWGKYADVIASIKEQIKQNHIQAQKNEEQAKLNHIQAEKNHEQALRNEEQAKLNQAQQERNKEQVRVNETQVEKNKEQAARNEEQARLNEIQQKRNQEQAVKNQEQARLNEIQAKKNQEQAEANQRFIKSITTDLIADKIIKDKDDLRELTVNPKEIIVNGVKLPGDLYKKYAAKYNGYLNGDLKASFSFSN